MYLGTQKKGTYMPANEKQESDSWRLICLVILVAKKCLSDSLFKLYLWTCQLIRRLDYHL